MTIYFFTLGAFSLIAQTILLRNIVAYFYGNEFFVSLILVFWLWGAGLGSKIGQKIKSNYFVSNIVLALGAISLPIFFLPFFRFHLAPFGQLPSFGQSLFVIFTVTFPLSFLLGSLFPQAIRKFTYSKKVARAYFWETLGMTVGGALLAAIFLFLPAQTDKLIPYFIKEQVLEAKNSVSGKIVVLKNKDQINFYQNGNLLGTTADDEKNEYFIHTILTLKPEAKKILLVGGGLTGNLKEILKYPRVQKVDYLEFDRALYKAIVNYLPSSKRKILTDPRLSIFLTDGRYFLKTTQQKYDLIIFALPNPSSFLSNRFYTQEAFREAKSKLEKNGTLITSLFLPTTYLSQEAALLRSSINQTLKTVFPQTLIIPQEKILFLAQENQFNLNSQTIEVKTDYYTPKYLEYLLASPQKSQIKQRLNQEAPINTDNLPAGVILQTAFWQTFFGFKLPKIILSFAGEKTIAILFILLVGGIFFRRAKKKNSASLVFANGLIFMAWENIILLSYQTKVGHLYQQISLLIACFLGSHALGNLGAQKIKKPRLLLKIALGVESLLAIVYISFWQNFSGSLPFLLFAVATGFPSGFIFPAIDQLTKKGKQYNVNSLYTADLWGSSLGALLISFFIIPILGISSALIFVFLLSLGLLFNARRHKFDRGN